MNQVKVNRCAGGFLRSRFATRPALLICMMIATAMAVSPRASAQLRAAVVKSEITPSDAQYLLGYQERKSTGVLDKIYHRIVAIDDGSTQFFLVSSDICLFSPAEYDKVAARLQKQYGINPLNVWWSTTHTHAAPEVGTFGIYGVYMGDRIRHSVDTAYAAMVEQKLIDGILEARKNLAPARLSIGWGYAAANINRRAVDLNGKASLGMNPDGPVDRRIGLLRLDKEDGKPLALIANYAMHGTVMSGANLDISGDAPGVVSEYVEQKIGAPMLYINGAAGNMAPIYSVYPNAKSGHLDQFKVLLGDKILDANQKISESVDSVKLVAGALTLETPKKPGLGWVPELAKYAGVSKTGDTMVRMPVRFLKISDKIALWSAPIELFCEVSNEVRDASPFPYTFYYGYTNGWFGYMPTAAEWPHGGYEVETVSPFTAVAAKNLSTSVLNYLKTDMQAKAAPVKARRKSKK